MDDAELLIAARPPLASMCCPKEEESTARSSQSFGSPPSLCGLCLQLAVHADHTARFGCSHGPSSCGDSRLSLPGCPGCPGCSDPCGSAPDAGCRPAIRAAGQVSRAVVAAAAAVRTCCHSHRSCVPLAHALLALRRAPQRQQGSSHTCRTAAASCAAGLAAGGGDADGGAAGARRSSRHSGGPACAAGGTRRCRAAVAVPAVPTVGAERSRPWSAAGGGCMAHVLLCDGVAS